MDTILNIPFELNKLCSTISVEFPFGCSRFNKPTSTANISSHSHRILRTKRIRSAEPYKMQRVSRNFSMVVTVGNLNKHNSHRSSGEDGEWVRVCVYVRTDERYRYIHVYSVCVCVWLWIVTLVTSHMCRYICVVNNKYVVRAAHLINCPVSRGRDISSPAGRVSACFCVPPVIYMQSYLHPPYTLLSVSCVRHMRYSSLSPGSHVSHSTVLYIVCCSILRYIYTCVATLSPQVIHLLNFLYFIENLPPYTVVIISSFLQSIINYNIARSCLKFQLFSLFTHRPYIFSVYMDTPGIFQHIDILSIWKFEKCASISYWHLVRKSFDNKSDMFERNELLILLRTKHSFSEPAHVFSASYMASRRGRRVTIADEE